jgi:hypothetical protein
MEVQLRPVRQVYRGRLAVQQVIPLHQPPFRCYLQPAGCGRTGHSSSSMHQRPSTAQSLKHLCLPGIGRGSQLLQNCMHQIVCIGSMPLGKVPRHGKKYPLTCNLAWAHYPQPHPLSGAKRGHVPCISCSAWLQSSISTQLACDPEHHLRHHQQHPLRDPLAQHTPHQEPQH